MTRREPKYAKWLALMKIALPDSTLYIASPEDLQRYGADNLARRFGALGEIAGGDELYPQETNWYFEAPKTERKVSP